MTAKLSTKLPDSVHKNGLYGASDEDLAYRGQMVAVVQLRPKKQTLTLDGTGEDTIELTVTAIEPFDGTAADTLVGMLLAARGRRTGHEPLPLEPSQEDIAGVVAGLFGQGWPASAMWGVELLLGTLLSRYMVCPECEGLARDPATDIECPDCGHAGLLLVPESVAA